MKMSSWGQLETIGKFVGAPRPMAIGQMSELLYGERFSLYGGSRPIYRCHLTNNLIDTNCSLNECSKCIDRGHFVPKWFTILNIDASEQKVA